MMTTTTTCVVCLDGFSGDNDKAVMTCGHALHVSCLINCAQYDVRCPVCRRLSDGVTPRQQEVPAVRDVVDEMDRAWRQYLYRRRRAMRTRPVLAGRVRQLKQVRDEMNRTYEEVHRVFQRKCREVWRTDPDVLGHRTTHTRLRRRERRLERSVQEELEPLIGPEPFL